MPGAASSTRLWTHRTEDVIREQLFGLFVHAPRAVVSADDYDRQIEFRRSKHKWNKPLGPFHVFLVRTPNLASQDLLLNAHTV